MTLPQLRPILLINTILISIFTLNTFDLILPLTGGGPGRATEVLALYAYNTVFRNFDLSNGAVLAVMLLLISLAFTLLLRPPAAEGDLIGEAVPTHPAWPISAPTSAYVVIFLFFAGPLLWLVSLSIRNAGEIFVSDLRILPHEPDAGELSSACSINPLFPTLSLERPEARGRSAPSARCSSPRRPPTPCRASASATATL